ncbi:MAG: CPBP family intramembrane metalloprotease [Ferruginibacter sp.]|nr:CPBP family intramembrane metalloprotease [Cytophagales bacterium]
MDDYRRNPSATDEKRPAYRLVSFLSFAVGGWLIASFVAVLLVPVLLGVTPLYLASVQQNPSAHPEGWGPMMLLLSLISLLTFVVTPVVYLTRVERRPLADLNANPKLEWQPVLAGMAVVIAFSPLIDLTIQWNQLLSLPDWLATTERWMKQQESTLEELTQLLTRFDTVPRLLIGLLVIAVIPAVGEELVFRGLLQKKLQAVVRNPHVAIWTTAILFSAIHTQFYGFLPRMLLGALFGYLYAWSGNLWLPIAAHFTNNALGVLLAFFNGRGSDYDVGNTSFATWPLVLASLLTVTGLLFYLRNHYRPVRNA